MEHPVNIVTRDNKPLAVWASDDEARLSIQHSQSQSVDWALTHEGYAIVEQPGTIDLKSYLGRDQHRARTWVELRLSTTLLQAQATTLHEVIDGPSVRVSLSGEQISYGRREVDRAGQIQDSLRTVFTEYDKRWSQLMIDNLVSLWDERHLNDMRAGCAHQSPVYRQGKYGREIDLDNTPACPLTGYKYGSAWLVDPPRLTAAGAAHLLRLFGWTP